MTVDELIKFYYCFHFSMRVFQLFLVSLYFNRFSLPNCCNVYHEETFLGQSRSTISFRLREEDRSAPTLKICTVIPTIAASIGRFSCTRRNARMMLIRCSEARLCYRDHARRRLLSSRGYRMKSVLFTLERTKREQTSIQFEFCQANTFTNRLIDIYWLD